MTLWTLDLVITMSFIKFKSLPSQIQINHIKVTSSAGGDPQGD